MIPVTCGACRSTEIAADGKGFVVNTRVVLRELVRGN